MKTSSRPSSIIRLGNFGWNQHIKHKPFENQNILIMGFASVKYFLYFKTKCLPRPLLVLFKKPTIFNLVHIWMKKEATESHQIYEPFGKHVTVQQRSSAQGSWRSWFLFSSGRILWLKITVQFCYWKCFWTIKIEEFWRTFCSASQHEILCSNSYKGHLLNQSGPSSTHTNQDCIFDDQEHTLYFF